MNENNKFIYNKLQTIEVARQTHNIAAPSGVSRCPLLYIFIP